MPIARVQLPDGRIGRFEVPEGTTPEQVQSFVAQQIQAPEAPAQQAAVPQPAIPSAPDVIGRGLGLGGRAVIQGAAAIPAMAANVGAALSNQIFGTQFPEQQQALGQVLTAAGLPEPTTPTERIASEVLQAGTGAGGLLRAGQRAIPVARQAIERVVAPEIAAAATGAGAAGLAEEAGAAPLVQAAAGLAGGIGGGIIANRANTVKTVNAALLDDVSERGIDDVGAFQQVKDLLGKEASKLQRQISGVFQDGRKVKPGLFDVAKERGREAFIKPDAITDLGRGFRQQALEAIDDTERSVLINAADRLGEFAGQTQIKVNDLETLRRSATQTSQRGGGQGAAGASIRRQIDDFLDETPEAITGDKLAVDVWKRAIAKRAEFGRKFEKPKEIAIAVTDEPIEVIQQKFLGSGPISSKRELGRVYDDTLKALPSDQRREAGFLMRQSVVNQMVKRAARTTDADEGVSASFMANQIRNLKRENKTVWNKFPQNEKDLLSGLERGLRSKAKGGPINQIGQFMFNRLGRATRSNLELPRTIKPKTILTVEELLELTKVKPSNPSKGIIGTTIAVQGE